MAGNEKKRKYMSADDMKRKLIDITYEMILEEGIEAVSARKIAKVAGCTAPLIYIHFENLNYLIVMASIRFLEPYFEEIARDSLAEKNPVESDRIAWHAFVRHSFRNPKIFENMFWGDGNKLYADAILEYLALYPQSAKNENVAYHYIAISNSSLEEREFLWLNRGVNEGIIQLEDAVYTSKVVSPLVRSLLLSHIENQNCEDSLEKDIKNCIAMIDETFDRNLYGSRWKN